MLQTVPSSVTLLSQEEDKTFGGEARVKRIYDIHLSPKNHLGMVKIGGIFLTDGVWITEFPITLASASVQKYPKKCPCQCFQAESSGFLIT